MRKAKFIVLEGLDASGKTTLSKQLQVLLQQQNYKVLWTKEPYYDTIKDLIMNVAKSKEDKALLFALDRNLHTDNILIPAFETYDFIICDRYIDSMFAYQKTYGTNLTEVARCNKRAFSSIQPDLTIFLDTPVSECIKRMSQRDNNDKLDEYNKDKLETIRTNYLKLYKKPKKKVIIIKDINFEELIKIVKES